MAKFFLALGLLVSTSSLIGCNSSGYVPSLSENQPFTSRQPSPGNIHKTNLMESTTMQAPTS